MIRRTIRDPVRPESRAVSISTSETQRFRGLLLAGFGGSVRYRPDGPNQYTQADAFIRAAMLVPALLLIAGGTAGALDVLITHSPPYGINDDDSAAHRGLKAINWLLRWTRPALSLARTHARSPSEPVSGYQPPGTDVHYQCLSISSD